MKSQNVVGLIVLVMVVIYTFKEKNFFQDYIVHDVETLHVKYLETSVGYKGQEISRFYCFDCSQEIKALYFPFKDNPSFLGEEFILGVVSKGGVGFKLVCYVSLDAKEYLSVEEGLKRLNENDSETNFFMLIVVSLTALVLMLIYFFREE